MPLFMIVSGAISSELALPFYLFKASQSPQLTSPHSTACTVWCVLPLVYSNFCLLTPKRHILARNRVVWRITRENLFRRLVGRWKNPKKKPSKHFDAQFRAYGEKNPLEGS